MPNRNQKPQPEADVIQLFDPERRNPGRPAPATDAELIEYRQMRPKLLKMLEEWEAIYGPGGCPVARQILTNR